MSRSHRLACAVLLTVALLWGGPFAARPARADQATWQEWRSLVGVVDVAGPRSDGALVVMAAGHLFLVPPDKAVAPFADGADGYAGDPDSEQYLVLVPEEAAVPRDPGGCSFGADDVLILDLSSPPGPGIARVDRDGHASRLATVPDVDGLWGIALDTVGRFGYRVLVAGTSGGQTAIFAINCRGEVATISRTVPTVEGGFVVAPPGFGPYGGDLIAADELSGRIWAIGPDGGAQLVAAPNLPAGGDTGVESGGFVPAGFGAGGFAYLADRGTPGNPFPGTDSLLRLSAQDLAAAGVQEGDLLVATEGGGTTVAIRCAGTAPCQVIMVANGPGGRGIGHIEGHIAVVPAPHAGGA